MARTKLTRRIVSRIQLQSVLPYLAEIVQISDLFHCEIKIVSASYGNIALAIPLRDSGVNELELKGKTSFFLFRFSVGT